MKALVWYDSFFGNTQQIAEVVAEAIRPYVRVVELQRIQNASPEDVERADILIVGSPTRGFQPSEDTKTLLRQLPRHALRGMWVAAFDTRIALHTIENGLFRWIVKTGGYAASTIHKSLLRHDGQAVIAPDGFCVTDKEGPLMEGELQRARAWGNTIGQIVGEEMVVV
ncbi:flavodoxin family protein [Phaeodactylibacter xiamenensis]|mgnify:FL=1|jgi:flavodoxin|uniref:flavodoxin family protein n=1 Tax=Phaeodactylibacter xiamenensis TaxID=1524460 RepID=UPI0024A9603B|nr:flavodoxin domain-containing protein [Phaeodactylibacter xiamenensis]